MSFLKLANALFFMTTSWIISFAADVKIL